MRCSRVSDQFSAGPIFGRASWTNGTTFRSRTCTSMYLSLCAACKPAMTWRAHCTAAPHQRKAEGWKTAAVFGQNDRYSTFACRTGCERRTAPGFEIQSLPPFLYYGLKININRKYSALRSAAAHTQ